MACVLPNHPDGSGCFKPDTAVRAVSKTNRMHSREISGRSLGNIARPDCGNERIRNGMSRSRSTNQQRIAAFD